MGELARDNFDTPQDFSNDFTFYQSCSRHGNSVAVLELRTNSVRMTTPCYRLFGCCCTVLMLCDHTIRCQCCRKKKDNSRYSSMTSTGPRRQTMVSCSSETPRTE